MAKEKKPTKIGFGPKQEDAEEATTPAAGIAADFRRSLGRPAEYATPEDLFSAIAQHFDDCQEAGKPPTVNSLSLALGFSQRNGLDYQAKRGAEFSNIVSRAKLAIASAWEEVGVFSKSANFAIFALGRMKGAGYEEKGFELEAGGVLKMRFGFNGEEEDDPEELSAEEVGVEG